MQGLKLISINIEGGRHWERVLPLLERESPHIICLQEIFEPDLSRIEALGYHTAFLKMTTRPEAEVKDIGVAVVAKHAFEAKRLYYHKVADPIYSRADRHGTMEHGVLFASILSGTMTYHVGTTHFTWTKDGLQNQDQKEDLANMLSLLSSAPPHILCGDFNIPRGYNELYDEICKIYRDEIPRECTSSIDLALHKVKDDPIESERVKKYMVDYIFSQPPYNVSDVRLLFGVSDHAAVIATVLNT